jgi:SAM-dependent methyltransferase
MIDRSLNYGRESVGRFLSNTGPLKTVVDLGAGPGADLLAARGISPSCRLVGVEPHGPLADRLVSLGVETHRLDLERDRLPVGDGSVDAVIANQILEHVKDIFWVVHEASRVLRVGGSLIVGVPNLASLHNRVLLAFGRQPTVIRTDSAHVRGFTLPDMTGLLDAGFPGGYRLRERRGANFYPLPPALARPMARLLPGMAWGMMLHLVKARSYGGEFLEHVRRSGYETRFYTGPG